MKKIEIYSSKKKSAPILIISLICFIGAVYILLTTNYSAITSIEKAILLKVLLSFISLFCGAGIYVSLKQLIKKKLFLIIDENGINVNPENSTSESIKWKNVESFSELKMHNQKMVLIEVNNPSYWIENESNYMRKKLIEFNLKNYGAPFVLSAISMDLNHDELLKVLYDNLGKFQHLT